MHDAESVQEVPIRKQAHALGGLYVVFVLSGFAALLYQVCWQRALFAIFGINIEAVTVVVTAFMLGLGVGSWFGGMISKAKDHPLLLYFAVIESGIGVFGLASLWVFERVGRLTLFASAATTAVASFMLVLFPTILMGATLPLLVAHAVRRTGSVGRSVAMLYFVNTLGSALAAFLAVLVCLPELGLGSTVRLAAVINIAVAFSVALLHAVQRKAA